MHVRMYVGICRSVLLTAASPQICTLVFMYFYCYDYVFSLYVYV
jgi:hypothetical protein